MPDDLFNNVAELARTCFLAGCYGYVSLYSKPSDTKIDNITDNNAEGKTCSVRNKDEISFQESEEEHSKVCDISSASNTPKQQPSFQDSGELCDKDLPKMDSAERLNSSDEDVCTFMRNYCFLLDLCKIRENLHSYQGNLFQFWCTYTRCLHEFYKKDIFFVKLMNKEVHYAVDILRTGNYCTEKVLSCVTKLFEENLDRALEICQDSPHIQPLDVYFMCQYHSQSVSQYFYPYMYNRVNDTITTNRHGDSVYGHSLVRLKWLEMLLVENRPADDLIGQDNLPRPGSHLADWKKPEFIIHVLNAAEDDMEREEFLGLLHSSGFWRGYLQLLQQLQRREDIFTTIVHLGDISLFSSKYNYVPQTKEEWTFVVHLLHRQYMSLQSSHSTSGALFKDQPATKGAVSKDNSEKLQAHPVEKVKVSNKNSENPDLEIKKPSMSEFIPNTSVKSPGYTSHIPWEDFASLMLCHLGPVATVTILQELDIHQGQLSAYFHQSALITMLLNRTKRNVTHNFLEKLDSYLWAKKPTTLMPELRYCVMQEKMAKGTSQRDRDSLISYMPEAAQPCERYQEDRESQWGISAKLSRSCMCCNLSLTEAVSHVEPGILTFQCGHLFHRLCVPEKMCLLCGLPSHQQPTHV
ncbi:BLOC-2 complex member HPS5-like [Ylistrum balloti]|uniref:BLOC-2 complex member HPS5-like n=1 Tax=Ylistrum balloti TaxID=509963 RepID=UPI002905CD51|nr:BLOC-2 complex member HPS5-like [Ylistrum balloti]